MDLKALFKIQYGLFAIGVEQDGRTNACIVNTLVQATADPPRLLLCMQKRNLTTELARAKGSVAISVLGTETPQKFIEGLGTRSGRDFDKLEDIAWMADEAGNPLFYGYGVVARFSAKIVSETDLGTHSLFLLEPTMLEALDGEATTYTAYRARKSGGSVAASPAKSAKKWVCTICHYVYDGETPFEELPDDWHCPVCGEPKSAFVAE